MLEKVKIKNFQSHRNTEIELSSAVNTIQGNSDCGKSAVMRALNWLIFNPAGDYFVSDWARKGKSISSPCEVTLVADGHAITRKRDKDFNGYVLDGQVFEATRNSVPPQVSEVLGLGEVNIQRQMDPPFLLSKSSGDVSRYINSLVNLTRIDEWTSAANGRSRTLSQKVESASARLEAAQKEVASYDFLPHLEELSGKLTSVAASIGKLESLTESVQKDLDDYLKQKEDVDGTPDVDKLFELLKSAEKKHFEFEEKRAEAEKVFSEVKSFLEVKTQLEFVPDLDSVEQLLSRAELNRLKASSLGNLSDEVSKEIETRTGISIPEIPEELFKKIEILGRYRRVQSQLAENIVNLDDEIVKHLKSSVEVNASKIALSEVERKLSTMVCPLCGRRGNHEEECK